MADPNLARAVRLPRAPRPPGRPGAETPGPAPIVPGPGVPEAPRPNRGAFRRAVRLSLLYAVTVAAIYAVLVALAESRPVGASTGAAGELLFEGVLAIVLGVAGVLLTIGSAPRSVELGERETVIVGRYGRRYRFPGRGRLRTVVLQRLPAGPFTPVPLEVVEIIGGTSRRSFLLEEGLLAVEPSPEGVGDAAPN